MKAIKGILFVIVIMTLLLSCQKDTSFEIGGADLDPSLIGTDCRISKIVYSDSATTIPLGSIAAIINTSDNATDITQFDSLGMFIEFNAAPVYSSDTVFVNPKEYFIRNLSDGLIKSFRGLFDPSDPASQTFDVTYTYNANGNLINKSYSSTLTPGIIFKDVTYTYSGGNLTHMTNTDLNTGNIVADADLTYATNHSPKNYLYLFPDESDYAQYNQFFNFGKRSVNTVQHIKVQLYDLGVPADSYESSFSNYVLSNDNYVVEVDMSGDDQPSIPVLHGHLKFSYSCK